FCHRWSAWLPGRTAGRHLRYLPAGEGSSNLNVRERLETACFRRARKLRGRNVSATGAKIARRYFRNVEGGSGAACLSFRRAVLARGIRFSGRRQRALGQQQIPPLRYASRRNDKGQGSLFFFFLHISTLRFGFLDDLFLLLSGNEIVVVHFHAETA